MRLPQGKVLDWRGEGGMLGEEGEGAEQMQEEHGLGGQRIPTCRQRCNVSCS